MATEVLALCQVITSIPISVQAIQKALMSCLEKLEQEITELVPGFNSDILGIKHKIESVYGITNTGGANRRSSIGSSGGNHPPTGILQISAGRLSNSTSMDEMKQKVGKMFKPSGSVQFWKK